MMIKYFNNIVESVEAQNSLHATYWSDVQCVYPKSGGWRLETTFFSFLCINNRRTIKKRLPSTKPGSQ